MSDIKNLFREKLIKAGINKTYSDTLPWEEWSVLEGKKIHDTLFFEKKDKFDGEFKRVLDYKDHPKEVPETK